VAIFTWIQSRVHGPMLGRAMSLFMFIFMGLVPLSSAATGWLMRHLSLGQVFVGSGAALAVGALLAWAASPMRRVDDALPVQPGNQGVRLHARGDGQAPGS